MKKNEILLIGSDFNENLGVERLIELIKEKSNTVVLLKEEPGTEGIITRISSSIVDMILKVVLNLKSSITGAFKDIRRSELESYIDAHVLSVTIVKKKNYTNIVNIDVAKFPFNEEKMKTIDIANKFITLINFKNKVIAINNILLDIYSNILNENNDKIKSEIKHLFEISDKNLSNNIFSFIKKNENSNIEKTTQFGNLFSSMTQFNEYIDRVRLKKNAINECVETVRIIESKTYSILDKIIDYLVKNPDFLKEYKNPEEFTKAIYNVAYFFDSCGHLFKLHNHIEHNIVNIFKALSDKI